MIPWKKWITYGVVTTLGAILGVAAAQIEYGYIAVAVIIGAAATGAMKKTEHILFTSALVLLYAILPHSANILVAAGTALATALIYRAMQGFSRPSR